MSEEAPLEKATLNFFKGDLAELRRLYSKAGASMIVRELVRNHIRKVHEEAQRNMPVMPQVNVEI